MNKITAVFFVFFFTLSGMVAFAQTNDAGLWMEISLRKKVSKKIGLKLTEEVRMFENISEVGSFLTEISGEYKLNKYADLEAGYRFTNKRQLDDSYSKRHRYFVSASAKHKFSNLESSIRIKYLSQYADIHSSEDGFVPKNYLRAKAGFKYDLNKKYSPFITGEMFVHVNNPEGWLFDNYRLTAGFEYEINKRSQVELRYLFNREIQVSDPWTLYVVSLSFSYKL